MPEPFGKRQSGEIHSIVLFCEMTPPGFRTAFKMELSDPSQMCTCADGMLAGYGIVGLFLVLFLVPRLYAWYSLRCRERAVAIAQLEP